MVCDEIQILFDVIFMSVDILLTLPYEMTEYFTFDQPARYGGKLSTSMGDEVCEVTQQRNAIHRKVCISPVLMY